MSLLECRNQHALQIEYHVCSYHDMTALGQLMLLLECRNPNQQHTEAGKHHTSHNVLAVVDFNLKFTYVLAG
jgi:hypothetical protein